LNKWIPAVIPVDERLQLRLLKKGDANDLSRLSRDNESYLKEDFEHFLLATQTLAAAEQFISEAEQWFDQRLTFLYGLFCDSQLVGIIASHVFLDTPTQPPVLSYFIAKDWQGQGIVRKAVATLTDLLLAQTDCDGVIALCRHANKRAINVVTKLGFVPLGLAGLSVAYGKMREPPPRPIMMLRID